MTATEDGFTFQGWEYWYYQESQNQELLIFVSFFKKQPVLTVASSIDGS